MPSTRSSDSQYSVNPFRNGPFQSLRDGLWPWVLLVLSLGAYLLTLQPGAFPGTPASLAAAAVGVKPNTSPSHFLWYRLMRLVAGSGGGMVWRMNLASAVFGALAVFLCWRVMYRLLTLVIEPTQIGHLPPSRLPEAQRYAARAARLGATAAALALAFCIPFWIASTRVYYHTFYVAWLFLAADLLLRYFRTRRLLWLALWAFVHAAGMAQTSAFLDFFPLLLALFLYFLWAEESVRPLPAIETAALAGILGLCLLPLAANAFVHSDGFRLTGYTGFWNCARRMVNALTRGTRGNLSQAPWLILIGLSVAPWAASLIAARRALNGENTWSFYGLHLVITVITVLVIADFRASPWRFMGTGNTTIVPYVLTAMTFGYIAAYLCLLPIHLAANSERGGLQRLAPRLSAAVALAFLALAVYAAVSNFRETNNRTARMYTLYSDRMLDSLDGREWLVTDGLYDDMLLLRARERGITVHCLNSSALSLRIARPLLKDVTLRNAANLGLQSLIQEWITHPESATRDLAMARFPDFWELGNLQMLPNKLLFLGETPASFRETIDPSAALAEHEAVWEEFRAAFDAVPDLEDKDRERKIPGDAPSHLARVYRDLLFRPQLSFVGNNLGFAVSRLSRDESLSGDRRKALADSAYEIYSKVHAFDPANISATLNWASKVFDREPADRQAEAREALNDINRKLDANLSNTMRVWSLSRYFGYVEDPSFFAILGWTWANTGQPNLAMQALAAAEKSMPEHTKARMKSAMARLHLAAARPDESEKLYFEMLVEDPGNREALMGLVHIFAFRGDTAKAREYLARAEQAGEPLASRQLASAVIHGVEGDDIGARAILQSLVNADPQNLSAWAMLCSLYFEQKDSAAMAEAIKALETRAGTEAYQTLIAKAMFAEMGGHEATGVAEADDSVADMRKRHAEARDYYVRALRTRPSNVMLLNRILTLDFQIADKPHARQHAMQILRQDLNAPFANYILGSLAIDDADYEGAEAYLRRSVENDPTIASLNDLADVLCHREQYDEAELRIQQAFQLPDAAEAYELWDTRGLVLMSRDKFDEAEAAFQRSLSLYGEDMRVHLHLATLYQRQNKSSLAAELVRTIARNADALPRSERRQFEDLHLKVLGVRFSQKDYQ